MRYIDIGTVSESKPAAKRTDLAKRGRKNKKSSKHPFRVAIGVVLLGVLVFGLYSYLPPIKEVIGTIFSGSSEAIKFVVEGTPELKKVDGKTNVLLMGIDRRDNEPFDYKGSDGQTYHTNFRSDTIIIASYNYESKRMTMLSLPRDLWVSVPAFGSVGKQSMKINGVYGLGDTYEYPGGGQALLAKVVSDVTGVPIQYTARIDFSGFEKSIDAVGGIDVTVKTAFTDYEYPIEGKETAWPPSSRYKTITFKKGVQHMNGQTALEFARSRHAAGEEGTDFARSKRQQLVIEAFQAKVMSSSTMSNPATLAKLYNSLGESFSTTASLSDLPAVLALAKDTQGTPVASYNLDDRDDHPGGILYAPPMANYGGAYVLIPATNWLDVRKFVATIFSAEGYVEASGSATPTTTGKKQ